MLHLVVQIMSRNGGAWFFLHFSSADFLSLARQGVFGGAFVLLRWALYRSWPSIVGVRQSAFPWSFALDTGHGTQDSHRQFTRKRIITGRGMTTYIQWRRIPDRSESVSKSNGVNVKSPNSRSQFTRSSPAPLSTRPNSRQPAFQNCNNLLAIAPIQIIQIPLDV